MTTATEARDAAGVSGVEGVGETELARRERAAAEAGEAERTSLEAVRQLEGEQEAHRAAGAVLDQEYRDATAAGDTKEMAATERKRAEHDRRAKVLTAQKQQAERDHAATVRACETANAALRSGHEWARQLRDAVPRLQQEIVHRQREYDQAEHLQAQRREALEQVRGRLAAAQQKLIELVGEQA